MPKKVGGGGGGRSLVVGSWCISKYRSDRRRWNLHTAIRWSCSHAHAYWSSTSFLHHCTQWQCNRYNYMWKLSQPRAKCVRRKLKTRWEEIGRIVGQRSLNPGSTQFIGILSLSLNIACCTPCHESVPPLSFFPHSFAPAIAKKKKIDMRVRESCICGPL